MKRLTGEPMQTIKQDTPFVAGSPDRKRTLEIGNRLKRKRKGIPNTRYEWAVVRDVIKAQPEGDTTVYVAVLCEGIEEHAGHWYIWRTYFTNNRHGRLAFGQYGPQAPLAVDKWLHEQIVKQGWYEKAAA